MQYSLKGEDLPWWTYWI